MAEKLADRRCVPCKGGVPPLRGAALTDIHRQLGDQWQVVNEHHLERSLKFENFREALEFVNHIGRLAEEQNHHPDIELGYGKVKVTIYTHAIDGLTESDFVLAAKIDELPR